MDNRTGMIRLIVFGNIPERSLKELAYQIEDDLGSLPKVSQVETTGTRNYEISIEVPLIRLRALGLTLDDVADAVRRSSLDLSAGSIDTQDAQVRVRTIGQSHDQLDFEEIVVIARNDGTVVRLGDIAHVRDAFQNSDLILRHQGRPAVFVEVYRAEGEQVMDVAQAVHEHIANVIAPSLPDGVGITIWNDDSQTYSERADILRKKGLMGLVLVFVALALFLEIRLALWVVAGLVTSGVGGAGHWPGAGQPDAPLIKPLRHKCLCARPMMCRPSRNGANERTYNSPNCSMPLSVPWDSVVQWRGSLRRR